MEWEIRTPGKKKPDRILEDKNDVILKALFTIPVIDNN